MLVILFGCKDRKIFSIKQMLREIFMLNVVYPNITHWHLAFCVFSNIMLYKFYDAENIYIVRTYIIYVYSFVPRSYCYLKLI